MFIEFRKIIGVSEEVSECTGAGIEFQRAHHVKVKEACYVMGITTWSEKDFPMFVAGLRQLLAVGILDEEVVPSSWRSSEDNKDPG